VHASAARSSATRRTACRFEFGGWFEHNRSQAYRRCYALDANNPSSPYERPANPLITQYGSEINNKVVQLHLQDAWKVQPELTLLAGFKSSLPFAEGRFPVQPAKGAISAGSLGLRDMAACADVVAPPTRGVIPLGKDERLGAPTSLVDDAHKAGLLLHTWTFRPENCYLAADFRDGAGENARNRAGSIAEMKRYIETGIDGFFSDDPGLGRLAAGGSV